MTKQSGIRYTSKDTSGKKRWRSEVEYDLGNDRRLDITVRHTYEGDIHASATVCKIEREEYNGKVYVSTKTVLGLGRSDGSDYNVRIFHFKPERVTEKFINEQMDRAMSHIETIMHQVLEHYGEAEVPNIKTLIEAEVAKRRDKVAA